MSTTIETLKQQLKECRQALRASRARFRNVIERNADGILVVDHDGVVRFANQAAVRLLGRRAEALVGAALGLPMALGETTEIDLLREDGEPRVAEMVVSESEWDGISVYLATLRDVTARRQTEARVEHLNQVLRAIRNVNQLIAQEDDPDRLIQRACDLLTETRGYHNAWIALFDVTGGLTATAESELGEGFAPLAVELRQGKLPACGRRALAQSGVVKVRDPEDFCAGCSLLTETAERGAMSVRLEHGGAVYGILTVSTPLRFVGDSGEGALLHEVAGDIALALHDIASERARRQAEEALRLANDIIVRSPAVAFVWENAAGWPVAYASDNAARIFGWKAQDFTTGAVAYADVVHPDDLDRVKAQVARSSADPTATTVEHTPYRILRKDGEVRWVEDMTYIRRAGEASEVAAYEGILLDITEQKRAEAEREAALEALRQERDRAQMYLDIAGVIIVALNAQGEVTMINQKGCEILGRDQDEVLGKHWFRHFVPARRRDPTTAAFGRLMAGEIEAVEHYENPILTKDGETRLIAWHNTLLRTDQGDVIGTLSSGEDITERQRTEAQRRAAVAALRESEEKYRLLAETTRDIIILHDLQGRILYVNRAGLDFADLERSEALSCSITDFVPDAYADDLVERRERRGAGEVGTYRYDIDFQKAQGDRIPMEVNSTGVAEDGKVSQVLVVARDITERRRAEQERTRLTTQLQEQARQTKQILTTVPAGVLLLDVDGRILQANPTAKRYLARLTGAGVGDTLTHLGDRPLAELFTSPPTKGLWHDIEANGRTFEAIARPVASALGSSGGRVEPEHWVLVVNDVTQERQIRVELAQQERLAAVGQLAAGIAHDFNNIMATIILYARMLERSEELSDRERERLSVINQQAWHATRLIEQILDFSRRAVLEKQPLDLVPLLKEQVKLLQRTLPEDIRTALSYGDDNYTIDADPTRIQQMVTNLAVNARDAMPGGGTLDIAVDRVAVGPHKTAPSDPGRIQGTEARPGEWIRLKVSDTGTGIAPEVLPRIFEPFFTTKAPGEGSGLGLPQVHGIVGQHGGYIDVESREGGGSTFVIYLPALSAEAAVETPAPDPAQMRRGREETILVVEDNEPVRAALVESLAQLNYRTLEAANGEEALALMAAPPERIALVLSDVVMPVMGGIALFRAVRERGIETPVILLTGHSMEDQEIGALHDEGLAAWMSKPPSLERLATVIDEILVRTHE